MAIRSKKGEHDANYQVELYIMDTRQAGKGIAGQQATRNVVPVWCFGVDVGIQPRPGQGFRWLGNHFYEADL